MLATNTRYLYSLFVRPNVLGSGWGWGWGSVPGSDPDARPADAGGAACGCCRLISSPGASASVNARSS